MSENTRRPSGCRGVRGKGPEVEVRGSGETDDYRALEANKDVVFSCKSYGKPPEG